VASFVDDTSWHLYDTNSIQDITALAFLARFSTDIHPKETPNRDFIDAYACHFNDDAIHILLILRGKEISDA